MARLWNTLAPGYQPYFCFSQGLNARSDTDLLEAITDAGSNFERRLTLKPARSLDAAQQAYAQRRGI